MFLFNYLILASTFLSNVENVVENIRGEIQVTPELCCFLMEKIKPDSSKYVVSLIPVIGITLFMYKYYGHNLFFYQMTFKFNFDEKCNCPVLYTDSFNTGPNTIVESFKILFPYLLGFKTFTHIFLYTIAKFLFA